MVEAAMHDTPSAASKPPLVQPDAPPRVSLVPRAPAGPASNGPASIGQAPADVSSASEPPTSPTVADEAAAASAAMVGSAVSLPAASSADAVGEAAQSPPQPALQSPPPPPLPTPTPTTRRPKRAAATPNSAKAGRGGMLSLQFFVTPAAKVLLKRLQYERGAGNTETQCRVALDNYFEANGLPRANGTER